MKNLIFKLRIWAAKARPFAYVTSRMSPDYYILYANKDLTKRFVEISERSNFRPIEINLWLKAGIIPREATIIDEVATLRFFSDHIANRLAGEDKDETR